ncbi:MAG: hypothetical protein KDB22_25520 [Planctomycetales bacterium]|nr:hypothetical protein [Planctomycetales bacterium]
MFRSDRIGDRIIDAANKARLVGVSPDFDQRSRLAGCAERAGMKIGKALTAKQVVEASLRRLGDSTTDCRQVRLRCPASEAGIASGAREAWPKSRILMMPSAVRDFPFLSGDKHHVQDVPGRIRMSV